MSENSEKPPEIEQKLLDFTKKADEKKLTCLICYRDGEDTTYGCRGNSRALGALCTQIFRQVARDIAAKDPYEYEQFLGGVIAMLADEEVKK